MAGSSSSSTSNQNPISSSATPLDQQLFASMIADKRKPKTRSQIKAEGDVKFKIGVLWVFAIILGPLVFFGGIIYLNDPNSGKEFWLIIMPIITASITGILGYIAGERNGSGK